MSLVNSLIKLYTSFVYRKFISQLKRPKDTQLGVLKDIIRLTEGSRYREKFSKVNDLKSFQSILPIVEYEDLKDISLTTFSPLFYEKTSGSSGKKKEIPYTRELLKSFTNMFSIWVHDILSYGPLLRGKKIYFSISPQFDNESIKIKADSGYVLGPLSWVLNYYSLVPLKIKNVSDTNSFFHIVSLFFIASNDLEIISIWSPTFLISILAHIKENSEQLIADLECRSYFYKGKRFKLPKMRSQKSSLLKEREIDFQKLFPSLKLISCWTSGQSKFQLGQIRKYFPDVRIQGKGLLATEAPITLPIINSKNYMPMLGECFFEFVDAFGKVYLLDEIKEGQEYSIIISQKSGLLRYKIGDNIHVGNKFYETPSIDFIGRSDNVSDLVGEKLNEKFCEDILNELNISGYNAIIPVNTGAIDEKPHYVILCSSEVDIVKLEKKFNESHHYHNAIKLNQLQSFKCISHHKMENYVNAYYVEQKGMILGDIKHRLLLKHETDGSLISWINKQIYL